MLETDRIRRMDNSPYPKPFPGEYPTRIAVQIVEPRMLTEERFSYIGKPVPALLSMVEESCIKKGIKHTTIHVTEFDQNGIVLGLPLGLRATNPVFSLYYPLYPELFGNISNLANLYILLAREVVTLDGRQIYRFPELKGTKFELPCQRLNKRRVKSIATKWASAGVKRELCDLMSVTADNKWGSLFPKPEKKRLLPNDPTAPDPMGAHYAPDMAWPAPREAGTMLRWKRPLQAAAVQAAVPGNIRQFNHGQVAERLWQRVDEELAGQAQAPVEPLQDQADDMLLQALGGLHPEANVAAVPQDPARNMAMFNVAYPNLDEIVNF